MNRIVSHTIMLNKKFLWALGFTFSVAGLSSAYAQQGEIESQTYEIVKEKSIEFPKANRQVFKLQPVQEANEQQKLRYTFRDPELKLLVPKITPAAVASTDEQERQDKPEGLDNYVKLGGGNYGRFLGDAFISGRSGEDLVVSAKLKHLSSATGPVRGKESANSATGIGLNAKYLGAASKVDGGITFDRDRYYFYGHRMPENVTEIDRDSLKQTLSRFGIHLGLENTQPGTLIDYSFKTALNTVKDRYAASEVDWGTNLRTSLPLGDNYFALFDADMYISQRVDALTYNRNLFRVKPAFKYASDLFAVSLGLNAVSETDNGLDVNRTRAYPDLKVDIKPVEGLHIFAGWNGDIIRNTLNGLLQENQWLGANAMVANTEKTTDIFGGVKGETMAGINYEAKVSYANYKNFYVFNNMLEDTSKFAVLYDGTKTKVLTISGHLGYEMDDLFKSSLKVNYFNYSMGRLEEAWHRPDLTVNWFNALTLSKKLFFTTDLYVMKGIKGKNFQTSEVVNLPAIADLNIKIDYLLTRNFGAFVGLNNIFGKNYQRNLYYSQQGLNFVGGLSISF